MRWRTEGTGAGYIAEVLPIEDQDPLKAPSSRYTRVKPNWCRTWLAASKAHAPGTRTAES